jgi:REP element-mobilizing transposase RayT
MPEPNTLFEVTCRTVQGRLLLRPSRKLNDIILGVLGRAMSIHKEIKLYAFVFASNHYHLLLSGPDYQSIAQFMNHINSNIARESGKLHNWREKFWGRRYRSIAVLDESSAVGRLAYFLAHGVKENLVHSPKNWPGVSGIESLLFGKKLLGHWLDRTGLFLAKRKKKSAQIDPSEFKTPYEVPLSPLPAWEKLSTQQRRAKVCQMVSDIEEDFKKQCRQTGQKPLGVKGVLAQEPTSLPSQVKHSPAPCCHAKITQKKGFQRTLPSIPGRLPHENRLKQ